MTASVKPPPELKKKPWLPKQQPKLTRSCVGTTGELRAQAYLRTAGYHILATNYRIHPGELDIIAWNPRKTELVFVEVKTSFANADHPSSMLTGQKLKTIIRTAHRYMAKHHLAVNYRFDMITVSGNRVEHFENITW